MRELPFPAVMQGLGFPLDQFKTRKAGQEWTGPCPVCRPKKNRGNFSYATDGKFRCFSCPAKGRGSLDLTMQVKQLGFQAAVDWLKSIEMTSSVSSSATCRLDVSPAKQSVAPLLPPQDRQPSENPPFKSTYEKFKVESPWLTARGLTVASLERFGVFQYSNPARRSVYNGSVMLRISRWSDDECVGYRGAVETEFDSGVWVDGV